MEIPENIILPRKSYGYKHTHQTRGAWWNLKMKGSRDCTMHSLRKHARFS